MQVVIVLIDKEKMVNIAESKNRASCEAEEIFDCVVMSMYKKEISIDTSGKPICGCEPLRRRIGRLRDDGQI